MKIQITRKVEHAETIEVELPYYFKHDLMLDRSDAVMYGKVEETRCTTIMINRHPGRGIEFEFHVDAGTPDDYSCYMGGKYLSNEAEYQAALAELRDSNPRYAQCFRAFARVPH